MSKMNIDNMTIGELKEIRDFLKMPVQDNQHPYKIGENYLIRTVTMIEVGRLVAVYPQELVIEDAAWVADTGRFSNALKTGELGEIEPYPDGPVIVGRGGVIDAPLWNHPLPRVQK